jgi:hypothetical protein
MTENLISQCHQALVLIAPESKTPRYVCGECGAVCVELENPPDLGIVIEEEVDAQEVFGQP